MIRMTLLAGLAAGCATSAARPAGQAQLGAPAPSFELSDLDGAVHRLADHDGKIRVLEWFNPGCPYVKYAHGEGPLRDQAKRVTEDGVVWMAINSGAPGKQGHGIDVNKAAVEEWSMGHPVLVDEDGAVGRAYGAITTPHMYVIDAEGTLVYRGAIDNAPFGRGTGTVKNFVDLALSAVKAGKPVETADTKPYGCSVKY